MQPIRKLVRSVSLTYALLWCAIVAGVFAAGWVAGKHATLVENFNNEAQPVRYKDPDYPLINPLVSVAIPNTSGFAELARTKSDVQKIIDAAKRDGTVSDVGVYLRIPDNAHWFGINENGKFDPGSLIKVPIMLALLKEAEANPAILTERLYYNSQNDQQLPNALAPQLPPGSYTTSKLLESMIVDSDNIAKDLLIEKLGEKAVQNVFDETGSNFLQDPDGTISPRQYVITLGRIYSATYLNRHYSNYAMELLTRATFKDGLVAGVPAEVKIAHKYGERGVYQDNALVGIELHDCGLVYAETPYYLCIMTKGTDANALASVIKNISAKIYQNRADFSTTQNSS